MQRFLLTALTFLLASHLALGEEQAHGHHEDEHHDHGHDHEKHHDDYPQKNHEAHTHGLGTVNLVYEAGELMLELESPAANILGFEHQPKTEAEKIKLKQAGSLLNKADKMFSLAPACQLKQVDVTLPFKDSASAHREHPKHQDAHQDIHAAYQWHCSKPLSKLTVNLFQHFSSFETINAQWIIHSKQGAATLSASNNAIAIKH